MGFPSSPTEGTGNTLNWHYLSQYLMVGKGSPIELVKGRIGALYLREDGAPGETLYVKESGDGTAEGWVKK